jgi:acetyl esterase/lipase
MASLTGPATLYRRLVIGDRALPCHADPPVVPTLLLHGAADQLVPDAQAHRLAARRRGVGLPTRLVTYPGAPHGFFNYDHPAARLALDEIRTHVTA